MKKIIFCLLFAVLILALAGCGHSADSPSDTAVSAAEAAPTAEPTPPPTAAPEPTPSVVTQTAYMNIDGIYVDSGYQEDDGSSLRMVYVFYTATTDSDTLKISSSSMQITINDANTYSAEHYPGACTFMNSYYYQDYLQDVYFGEERKFVETFKIPEGELAPGRTLSFSKSQIPETDKLVMKTDDIITCDSPEEIAQAIDPDGYAEEQWKQTDADAETIARVKEQINGYEWSFYVNNTSYKIEFWDNQFNLSVPSVGVTNIGTYSVKNGYIYCTSDSNGAVVKIPYTFDDSGEIDLDVTYAYDIRAN